MQTAEGKDSKVAKDVVANTPENAPVFNFWGVANALADSVKKTTADISARLEPVSNIRQLRETNCIYLADLLAKRELDSLTVSCSVGETDWRAELEAFSKGVREDATEVQRHAQKAAKDGASRLESLPQQAANAQFPRVDPDRLKTQFDQASILIASTHDRLDLKHILLALNNFFSESLSLNWCGAHGMGSC